MALYMVRFELEDWESSFSTLVDTDYDLTDSSHPERERILTALLEEYNGTPDYVENYGKLTVEQAKIIKVTSQMDVFSG